MWISRILYDIHLIPNIRDSFSPVDDVFSEVNGKRRRKCRMSTSNDLEAFYVKRTSQFYCCTPPSTPTPENDDMIVKFFNEKRTTQDNDNSVIKFHKEKTTQDNDDISIVKKVSIHKRLSHGELIEKELTENRWMNLQIPKIEICDLESLGYLRRKYVRRHSHDQPKVIQCFNAHLQLPLWCIFRSTFVSSRNQPNSFKNDIHKCMQKQLVANWLQINWFTEICF